MADIGVTKMSSKGQIVIPADMREDFREGEKIIVFRNDKHIILKKATEMDEKMAEDIEFARRTEEAWKRYEKGEFITMDAEEFIKELKKW
jgi:AbrB family looped-hinge helix DNA binding protein